MRRFTAQHASRASLLGKRFVERLVLGRMVDRTAKQNGYGPLRTVAAPKGLRGMRQAQP
jgi:hypothetical protein